MKKISVIIAAYNAEEYLSETLDSIFLQTMNDSEYEVIIINDGSSDSTLDILNSFMLNLESRDTWNTKNVRINKNLVKLNFIFFIIWLL